MNLPASQWGTASLGSVYPKFSASCAESPLGIIFPKHFSPSLDISSKNKLRNTLFSLKQEPGFFYKNVRAEPEINQNFKNILRAYQSSLIVSYFAHFG